MVVIPMFVRPELKDTPEQYESRCIASDARRAAMMQESPAKACFWHPSTPQYTLWIMTYAEAVSGRHPAH